MYVTFELQLTVINVEGSTVKVFKYYMVCNLLHYLQPVSIVVENEIEGGEPAGSAERGAAPRPS